jgi:hypothetical protein
MSIEKELLKRVLDVLRGLEETHYDLYWDIQTELEKIEQKPNNVGYLYKQKDCYGEVETVFKIDKPYITWHNVTDVTPVYLAPPKSEPFGPEIRERMSKAYNTKCEQIAFQEGIVFAEISHGIGVVE